MLVLATREIKDIVKKKKIRRIITIGIIAAFILSQIIMLSLPLEFYDYSETLYVFGGTASIVPIVLGAVGILMMLFGMTMNKDIEMTKSQKIPIYFCTILLTVMVILQYVVFHIEFNFENFMFSIILMTLYFTLENQDNMILEELEESKQEADIADKAQTDFLTSMSHEIRTPMNSILGFSESLLNEKDLTEEIVKRDMDSIHSAAMVLLMLINNILDISRIESGREQVVVKEYDLQDLIYEINSLMMARIGGEITFDIKVDKNLPKRYTGDNTKLSKIVVNILTNALNYTEFGKITLDVTQKKSEEGNFILSFLVCNSGHAMREEDFKKDFNDFVNIKATQDSKISSVTLGLMVAKQYAEMMGGSIDFLNETGKGTRYFIDIPQEVIDANPVGDIFASVAKDKPEHKLFDLTGKRVLVVDDNKVNIKLATRLLEGYNVTIDTADSGNECVEKVKENQKDKPYDIIFLDHMMPEMDGVATLKLLKSYGYNLPPIIALTANSYPGVRDKYIELGFTDYLAKPISYKELNKCMYKFFYKDEEDAEEKIIPKMEPLQTDPPKETSKEEDLI
jgi:signal transduction histidine kinase/CheY-like chemotaxis protein